MAAPKNTVQAAVEPQPSPAPYVGQTVSIPGVKGGQPRAAIVVFINPDKTANLQVFMNVQADRDNPGLQFLNNVPFSDFDF